MDYRNNRGDRTSAPLMMDRTVESEQKWKQIPPPSLNNLVPPDEPATAMKAATSANSDYNAGENPMSSASGNKKLLPTETGRSLPIVSAEFE